MAKRKEARINKTLMISFDEEGFDNLGLTRDLSKYGMGISATKKYPSSQEVIVSIAVPGEVFNLKGEVIWCNESEEKESNIPESIGIKITEAPAEYLNYIEFLKHQKIKPGEPEL